MVNDKTYSIEIAGHIMDNVNATIASDDDKLREALRAFFPNEIDPTKFSITREESDISGVLMIRFVPATSALVEQRASQLHLTDDAAVAPIATGEAVFEFASASAPMTMNDANALSQTMQATHVAKGAPEAETKPKPNVEAITPEDLAKRGVSQCEFHFEGQITPIKLDVAFDDATIKLLFSTIYPEVKDAHFTRSIKDGKVVVKAVKVGGPKSASGQSHANGLSDEDQALAKMIAAPATYNPMYALWFKLERMQKEGGLDLLVLMLNQGPLEYALEAGEAERREMDKARQLLAEATPVPYARVPAGF